MSAAALPPHDFPCTCCAVWPAYHVYAVPPDDFIRLLLVNACRLPSRPPDSCLVLPSDHCCRRNTRRRRPPSYRVLLHNDNYNRCARLSAAQAAGFTVSALCNR